jgi:cyclohexyl-isocyanide hydratase
MRIQLLLEYDPAPPFQSGSPAAASEATVTKVTEIMAPIIDKRRDVAERIGREMLKL